MLADILSEQEEAGEEERGDENEEEGQQKRRPAAEAEQRGPQAPGHNEGNAAEAEPAPAAPARPAEPGTAADSAQQAIGGDAPPTHHPPRQPGRGWQAAGARQMPYEYGVVTDLGRIVVNFHESAMSLDAHCSHCTAKLNRKFLGSARRPESSPQGRPMGLLLCWLMQSCNGDASHHRRAVASLSLEDRMAARIWGMSLGTLDMCFAKERPPRRDEDEEPQGLC